jgi:hypothetical protein
MIAADFFDLVGAAFAGEVTGVVAFEALFLFFSFSSSRVILERSAAA